MAKDRKKLQHIHSSIVDKQPTAASLEVGEIAVNNASVNGESKSFLSIKNSENKVDRFSSDGQVIDWMEKKEVIPYSGVVDNVHLDTNRSNIEIKLNQVVASNTAKHDLVNGAKDIDGNLVNPTSDSGLTNGAGFAIDMSPYALIGGNPSFSGITTTCYAKLNGTTEINGTNGDCGSLLKIDVNSATTNVISATTIIGDASTTVSGTNTVIVNGLDKETYNGNRIVDVRYDDLLNVLGDRIEHITGGTSQYADNILISSGSRTNINSDGNICVTSQEDCDIYGARNTNIGVSCLGDTSYITEIQGNSINISAATNVNISGNTVISGDTTIGGDLTIDIPCNTISSSTVNNALCEIFNRSEVTMTRVDTPSDSRLSATYRLWQNGSQIGYDIDVPKDGFLKEVTLVEVSGVSYLRFVWNVYDAESHTYSTGSTDVNVEDLVKDIDDKNPSDAGTAANHNVLVDVHYDSTEGKMLVSASTTPTMNVTNLYASNTISAATANTTVLNAGNTVISGTTNISGETKIDNKLTVTDTLDAQKGLSKKLTATYEATSGKSGSVVYNASGDTNISIPTCVSHLNRRTLAWSAGTFSASSYDPGNATCSGTDTISIPSNLSHLTDWNSNCLSINNNVCISGTVTSTGGMFTSSDEVLKDDINYINGLDISRANRVHMKSFKYKSDPSGRKVYGIIAQDVEEVGLKELVHYDNDGIRSVDYTGFLILKIAALEKEISILKHQFTQMQNKKEE